ncbi:hypothetical protein CPB84DRAFT_1962798 [Gymnopilus junonius]|uniref:Uncharacterized protein n=1 Tax=Gymnopilus junonius TaxID=109634 RepID=A0A9P5TLG5_GYMJU|nr:hypothetical protein CPB84DRAFT_1962798 [Gymnopilus junonius]
MRTRKLAHGQSIVFCAPPEIDRHIRESENIRASRPVKVVDVLNWVMAQTRTDIKHHIPLWANLGEMYGVTSKTSPYHVAVDEIPAMHEWLKLIGIKTIRDADMEEEQEREVSHEVEQELQLERPPKVEPASHRLDTDVRKFIKDGIKPFSSPCFLPLLKPLHSKTETLSLKDPWSKQLLCSRDFLRTTKLGTEMGVLSDYYALPTQHRAGQLYFDEYDTYIRLCFLLGISPNEAKKERVIASFRRGEGWGRWAIYVCLIVIQLPW